jgi:LCP family protein required for cell wall assembly
VDEWPRSRSGGSAGGGSGSLPPEVRRAIRSAAPSRDRQQRQRRRRHRLTIILACVLVAVLVVVVGGYGYAHWRFGQIASINLPGLHKAPQPGKPMVLLVVGSDSRSALTQAGDTAKFGTTQGQRSDVIMLVRIVPASHQIKILSIPRDTLVHIAGTSGSNKINAAFDKGPEQLIETIQQDFGIPINHYLLVNFDGFRSIINALGGINLSFPFPVRDWDGHQNLSGLNITRTGCVHLNGDQALSVARSRHYQYLKDGVWHDDPLSDLGRIQRQQTFLRVVLKKGLSEGLTNPLKANQFIGAVVHQLTIDSGMSVGTAVSLARQFRSFDPNQLANVTLPTTVADHYPGFGDVLLPNPTEDPRVIASFLGQSTPSSGSSGPSPAVGAAALARIGVKVQNGTRIGHLAARVAGQLHGLGVSGAVVDGNALPSTIDPAGATSIRYPAGAQAQAAAQSLAGMILGTVHLQQDTTLPASTLVLVVGTGYQGLRNTHVATTATAPPTTAAKPATPSGSNTIRDFDPRPC